MEHLLRTLRLTLLLGLFSLVISAWLRIATRLLRGDRVLPDRLIATPSRPPWGSGTVLLSLLLFLGLSVVVMGVYRSVKREFVPAQAGAPALAPAAQPAESPAPANPLTALEQVGLTAVVNVLLIPLLPLLAWFTAGARLRDFGLSRERLGGQLGLGFGAGFFVVPIIYLVQALAGLIWSPNQHELSVMLERQFSPAAAVLGAVTAVILAPILEEMLFRSILQRWLIALFDDLIQAIQGAPTTASETDPTPTRAAGYLAPTQIEPAEDATREAGNGLAPPATAPAAAMLGIALTSFLFGIVHAPQWPAPVPLFLFAAAIGLVYQRTGSLIAAICMHATLNGISTGAMLLMVLFGTPAGGGGPRG